MSHHKKHSKCGCEKKQHKKESTEHKKEHKKEHKEHKEHKKEHKEHKKEHKKCGSVCECNPKFYFPLPNLPSQPVGGMKVGTDAWFAPGSVQSCCAICSSVQPVYANPCNTCRYDNGTYPINNTAYFTTSEYIF